MNDTTGTLGSDHLTSTTTRSTVEVKPGFFSRMASRFNATLDQHPIAASTTLSCGIGAAAISGLNYRRYGTVLGPRFGEVVVAGAKFAARLI